MKNGNSKLPCVCCKQKFVVFSFVDEETNGSYPFANGQNGTNGQDGLAHLCHSLTCGLFFHIRGCCLKKQAGNFYPLEKYN
jgi:hypothetical protein